MPEAIHDGRGNAYLMKVNEDGSICNTSINDYIYDIALGNVEGYKVVSVRGRNKEINQSTTEDIWDVGGTIKTSDTGVTLFSSSTSVGDDQIMIVQGLDDSFNEQTGIAILNGQTQVEVKSLLGQSITWTRFFLGISNNTTTPSGEVYFAESDTLTNGVPDTQSKKWGMIALHASGISNGRTFTSLYTVPTGKSAFSVNGVFTTGRGKDSTLSLWATPFGGARINNSDFDVFENTTTFQFNPISGPLPEKTDLNFSITANNDSTQATIVFTFIVIDNDQL